MPVNRKSYDDQGTIDLLFKKLNESYYLRKKLEDELKFLEEQSQNVDMSPLSYKNALAQLKEEKNAVSNALKMTENRCQAEQKRESNLQIVKEELHNKFKALELLSYESNSAVEYLEEKVSRYY